MNYGYGGSDSSFLIALKLKLDALGTDVYSEQRNVKSGKEFQCAVYISQELGVAFRFRYGWYTYGIYSPDLTEAMSALYFHGVDTQGYELSPKYKWAIKKSRQILENGPVVRLANYHFLRSKSKVDHEKAVAILNRVGKGYDDSVIEYLKVYKLWDKEWDSHKSHKESV